MIISFLDNDSSQKEDETGHNKVGYVTSSKIVFFRFKNRISKKPLCEIEKYKHECFELSDELKRSNVDSFFLDNYLSTGLFNIGLTNLIKSNAEYFNSPIKLPKLCKNNLKSKLAEWEDFKSLLRPGDMLFTFDSESITSKVISSFDAGPWSHVATISSKETLLEAITSGVCERSIDVYKDSRFHLGLYRIKSVETADMNKSIEFAREQIGKKYSFFKAFIAGLQKLFGFERSAPTPNDLAIEPKLELIYYI